MKILYITLHRKRVIDMSMHALHSRKHYCSRGICAAMYRFLESKPVVVAGEILNSKARNWVATLMDKRFPEERDAVGFLKIALASSMDQRVQRQPAAQM